MNRRRVLNRRPDPGRFERRPEHVAPIRLNDVEMKHVLRAVGRDRCDERRAFEELVVPLREVPPPIVPRLEVTELRLKDGSLQRVEPAVETVENVLEPAALAVVAKQPCTLGDPSSDVTTAPASPSAPRFFVG